MKKTYVLLTLGLMTMSSCSGQENNSSTEDIHKHVYSSTSIVWDWQKGSLGYDVSATFTCQTCNEVSSYNAIVSSEITVEATCKQEGERKYTASVTIDDQDYFDYKTVSISRSGHQFAAGWQTDETYHYHVCSSCNEVFEKDEHDWSSWTTIDEASYENEGLEERTCLVCDYKETRTIDKLVPNKDDVQSKIDSLNAKKFPFSYQKENDLFYEYNFLTEEDKASITGYDEAYENKEIFESDYEVISDARTREVRNQDAPGLGYAGTWNGNITKGEDELYSYVNELDIQSVGTGWGGSFFNGISFAEELKDMSDFIDFTFAIYNPNEETAHCLLYTQGWYRIPNETTTYSLLPGWNEFTIDVKNNAYNSTNGETDATLDNFSIIIMDNQVGNPWKITSFIGRKVAQSTIQSLINKIDTLPNASDVTIDNKEAIYEILDIYNSLTESAKEKITNYSKFEQVLNAYLVLTSGEVIDLINNIPETLDNPFAYFAILDQIENRYESLTDEAKEKITNYSTYLSKKAIFDNEYSVIFNPRISSKNLAHEGAANCNDVTSVDYDENYGPVYKIDVTCSGGTYQSWTYNWPNITFQSTNMLIFNIYSPFETIENTSQTFFVGEHSTAKKITLNPQGWTNIYEYGGDLNSDGSFQTTLNGNKSFLNLQRYANGDVLSSPYSGTYYISAILAKL